MSLRLHPGSTDFFYWSLNEFGLKPLFRMNHVVIYPLGEDHNAGVAIACKMLYASHYFHSALELRFLVRDTANPTDVGFFLISVNRSRSDGLTGLFGSILKSQAVKRAREGVAGVLANGKKNLVSLIFDSLHKSLMGLKCVGGETSDSTYVKHF